MAKGIMICAAMVLLLALVPDAGADTQAPSADGSTSTVTGRGADSAASPVMASLPSLPVSASVWNSPEAASRPMSAGADSGAGPGMAADAQAALPLADRVLVDKGDRRLYLLRNGDVLRAYRISLGLRPEGHKQFEGDFRTPEGVYRLTRRNPNSEYFLSIQVDYPNAQDQARARRQGLSPGGAIMIHGEPNAPRKPRDYYANVDWTEGCIAVSNSDMVEIWLMTPLDTPIEIRP
jgi:hypothetical protein